MADDGSAQSNDLWPMSKFHFEVKWDDVVMHFQEVSGLDAETQPIEYRHGDSAHFSVTKMPGLRKFADVTMKKGVFKGDPKRSDWFGTMWVDTLQRKTVVISLLDESGTPAMVWTLDNAWPSKISGTDLKAQGNDMAVETLVMSHEGLHITDR